MLVIASCDCRLSLRTGRGYVVSKEDYVAPPVIPSHREGLSMFTGSAVDSAVIPPRRAGLRVFHFRMPPMRLSFRIRKGLVLHVPVQDLEEHILIVCLSTGCFDILGTDWIYWGSNAILKDRMSSHPAFPILTIPVFCPSPLLLLHGLFSVLLGSATSFP